MGRLLASLAFGAAVFAVVGFITYDLSDAEWLAWMTSIPAGLGSFFLTLR